MAALDVLPSAGAARTMVAPCILYIHQEAASIPVHPEVCTKIVQLLREVQVAWASEAIAKALIPHVALLTKSRSSIELLSIAMCYSKELYLQIYRQLRCMHGTAFKDVDATLLPELYMLTFRVFQVAQHVPEMGPIVYTMLLQLYVLCSHEAPQ